MERRLRTCRARSAGAPVRWPITVPEAKALQMEIGKRIRIRALKRRVRLVAGCDASYAKGKAVGAVCLYSYPSLELLEEVVAVLDCPFPYVPGYLSFREGPAIEEALGRLKRRPDLLMFDGQGIAHPRGVGIASHMGVVMGIPSVGCAKSRLVGTHRRPGAKRGSRARLLHGGRAVGAVLTTRDGVKPVFVSPGHGIDLEGAVKMVLGTAPRYRLPEPIRCAHRAAWEAGKVL